MQGPIGSRRGVTIRFGGNNDQAIVQLCAIILTQPDDLDARELLFDAFFQQHDWSPALALAEELARRQPDNPRFQKALIATLSNMKRYRRSLPESVPLFAKANQAARLRDAGRGAVPHSEYEMTLSVTAP